MKHRRIAAIICFLAYIALWGFVWWVNWDNL